MSEPRKSWRSDIKQWATWAASSTDDIADTGVRRLRRRMGWAGRPKIQPYIGYATRDTIRLHGRVLTNPPVDPDFNNDRWWKNLSHTMQRFSSDEVPGVQIQASAGGSSGVATSDSEGYFHLDLPRDVKNGEELFWSFGLFRIIDHEGLSPEATTTPCRVMYTPPVAEYGIISDVDDTIVYTGATDISTMAKLTILGNARTRAVLDGVAKLYELMQHAGDPSHVPINPIFYISSSPWNLYDLLEDFLELNAIPLGPLLLRDLGFDNNKFVKEGHDHKLIKARSLLNLFDDLPFVLFGDSGQEDARLYTKAAEEFGARIKAVFIRDVDPGESSDRDDTVNRYIKRCEMVGVPMHLIRDSTEAAAIAHEYGLLPAHAKQLVADATARDRERKRNIF